MGYFNGVDAGVGEPAMVPLVTRQGSRGDMGELNTYQYLKFEQNVIGGDWKSGSKGAEDARHRHADARRHTRSWNGPILNVVCRAGCAREKDWNDPIFNGGGQVAVYIPTLPQWEWSTDQSIKGTTRTKPPRIEHRYAHSE